MKTLIIAAVIAATLAGCAEMHRRRAVSPSFTISTTEGNLAVTGTIDQIAQSKAGDLSMTVTNTLTVGINGAVAARGMLTRDYQGNISGEWRGHDVTASCLTYHYNMFNVRATDVRCQVYIDGTHAGELAF